MLGKVRGRSKSTSQTAGMIGKVEGGPESTAKTAGMIGKNFERSKWLDKTL